MKATNKFINQLISALTTLTFANAKMPELIPVRVVTKNYRDQNR